MLLTTRKLLQSKMLDLENDLRGTLKNFGFKDGKIGAAGFEARVRELVDGSPSLRAMVIRSWWREQHYASSSKCCTRCCSSGPA